MEHGETERVVVDYLAEHMEIEHSAINLKSNLFNDLGMDSIDALDMIAALEERLNIEFEDDELKHIRTVEDVVVFVESTLGRKSGA
ncbi:MAG: acyl carrier protein [Deltaproteobacteria bacterium]|nr:acyl carrier protein [Deltaproteobacteria bacterium]